MKLYKWFRLKLLPDQLNGESSPEQLMNEFSHLFLTHSMQASQSFPDNLQMQLILQFDFPH